MKAVIFTGHFEDHPEWEKWAQKDNLKKGELYKVAGATPSGNLWLKRRKYIQNKEAFVELDFLEYEIRGCIDTGEEILSNVVCPTFWTLYGLRKNDEGWLAIYDYPRKSRAMKILQSINELK